MSLVFVLFCFICLFGWLFFCFVLFFFVLFSLVLFCFCLLFFVFVFCFLFLFLFCFLFFFFAKQIISDLVLSCIVIEQLCPSIHDENLLVEIWKFVKFSFLRNPYYHDKDESPLRRGYQVKPLPEMVSAQFQMQYT